MTTHLEIYACRMVQTPEGFTVAEDDQEAEAFDVVVYQYVHGSGEIIPLHEVEGIDTLKKAEAHVKHFGFCYPEAINKGWIN